MTATTVSAEPVHDDRLARRNVWVLASAQALAGANQAVIVTTGGIIGSMLAPDKGLATLPIGIMVIGMWLGTLPLVSTLPTVTFTSPRGAFNLQLKMTPLGQASLCVPSGKPSIAGYASC